MTQLSHRGIKIDSLQILLPILEEWLRINEEWDDDDAAWWYNERAVLSIFAGTIWRCGGWAIEEFSTDKLSSHMLGTRYKGRCDLAFGVQETDYWCEAKQCFPDLSNSTKALKQVYNEIERATQDVKNGIEQDFVGLALVFVSPFYKANKSNFLKAESNIVNFINCLQQFEDVTLAWTFPRDKLRLASTEDHDIYPGGVLIIKPVN